MRSKTLLLFFQNYDNRFDVDLRMKYRQDIRLHHET